MASNIPPGLREFLPVRFKESLYAPLKFARCALTSSGSFEPPTVTAMPPAPAAVSAPLKVFNTKLEKAVIDLYDQMSLDAGKLVAAAESFSALAAEYKKATDEESQEEKREDDAAAALSGAVGDIVFIASPNAAKRPRNGATPPSAAAAAVGPATASNHGQAADDSDDPSRLMTVDGPLMAPTSIGRASDAPNVRVGAVSAAAAGSPPAAVPWTCSTCTFINGAQNAKCDMCEEARPALAATTAAQPPVVPKAAGTTRPAVTLHASAASSFALPVPTAEWNCRQCTSINAAADARCTMCGTAKLRPAPGGGSAV